MIATPAHWRLIGTAILALALYAGGAFAQSASSPDIKAAFIFNFARFVAWPAARLADAQPITVGVIGDDAIADSLASLVKGKSIDRHSVVVKRLAAGDDVTQVHVLFVGTSAKNRVSDILARVGSSPVLTVSDLPRFCAGGGMIQLRNEDDRVRFDVGLDRAEASGLTISSKLLALAGHINPAKTD